MAMQGPHSNVPTNDANTPVVFVVDDDDLMRASLRRLLVKADLAVELYASGAEFIAQARLDRHGCVLLDVGMPHMSGPEVQAHLNERRLGLPVIFLTGSSEIPVAVAAMREGAVDFIEKPFDNDDVVARVRKAIARSGQQRRYDVDKQAALQRVNTLTPRECAVMELVVAGKTTKEIARTLDASPRTIEIHRSHLMDKMGASTLADLVRMRLSLDDGALSHPAWSCDQIKSPKKKSRRQPQGTGITRIPKPRV
jgi:FixJ family two-component response regulator